MEYEDASIKNGRKAKEAIDRIRETTNKDKQIHIRVTDDEKKKIEENAARLGFRQVSEYMRFLALLEPTYGLIDHKAKDGSVVVDSAVITLENKQ
jgi:hypothetical protein